MKEYIYSGDSEYNRIYGGCTSDTDELVHQLKSKLSFDSDKLDKRIKEVTSIQTDSIEVTLFMVPTGSPRPRQGGGHMYVKGQDKLRRTILSFIPDDEWITTGTSVHCDFYLPMIDFGNPEDTIMAEMGLLRPQSTPDWDNLPKGYIDALYHVILLDDRLIHSGTVNKYYSIQPRIFIRLTYNKEVDCKYNLKKLEAALKKISK